MKRPDDDDARGNIPASGRLIAAHPVVKAARCESTNRGDRCDLPVGHAKAHVHETSTAIIAWANAEEAHAR